MIKFRGTQTNTEMETVIMSLNPILYNVNTLLRNDIYTYITKQRPYLHFNSKPDIIHTIITQSN
jgi:hypothetical protein